VYVSTYKLYTLFIYKTYNFLYTFSVEQNLTLVLYRHMNSVPLLRFLACKSDSCCEVLYELYIFVLNYLPYHQTTVSVEPVKTIVDSTAGY